MCEAKEKNQADIQEGKSASDDKRQKFQDKKQKRWEQRQAFVDTMIDWYLEDLSEQIKDGRVCPVITENKTVLKFVLPEAWHDLKGEMRHALVIRLSKKLRDEWDSVQKRAARGHDDSFVGVRFTVFKHSKSQSTETGNSQ